jgi:hypothetical protein
MEFEFDNRSGRYEPSRRMRITVELPRSWWRRVLRLPGKRVVRGPYVVEPWPDRES